MKHLIKKYEPRISTLDFNIVIVYCFKILFKFLSYVEIEAD